jgi:hypothetical protein
MAIVQIIGVILAGIILAWGLGAGNGPVTAIGLILMPIAILIGIGGYPTHGHPPSDHPH